MRMLLLAGGDPNKAYEEYQGARPVFIAALVGKVAALTHILALQLLGATLTRPSTRGYRPCTPPRITAM